MRPRDGISDEVSAIWQEMVGWAGRDDPTETLVPHDVTTHAAPAATPHAAAGVAAVGGGNAADQPTPTGRHQRVAMSVPELEHATRNYHEFNRRYRLQRVLGEGGMGAVYQARQHALAREVAVKVLRSEESQERKKLLFRAEALVTAYLEHPNIIPVYDAADHCLVMKHVRGVTMEEVIERDRSRTAIARNVEILIKASDAIRFAHSRGIIHRDIKAKNIMVGEYGEVLVLDWGLALSIAPGPDGDFHGPRLDRCPHVCAGTPGCLPPEIARGNRGGVGVHSDLFMLGALLYHVLAGDLPFHSPSTMESLECAATNHYAHLDRSDPHLPLRLVEACEQAMATSAAERGTVDGFVDLLRRWLLTAGNEEAALDEAEAGRNLMTEADRLSDKGDQSGAWLCRSQAVEHLERALALLPDSTGLTTLHVACLEALDQEVPPPPQRSRWWCWWK